jgi:hypothetical protein
MVVNERVKLFTGTDAKQLTATINDFLENDVDIEYFRDIRLAAGAGAIIVAVIYDIEPARCLKVE